MKRPNNLTAKLNLCELEIKNYVLELESKNATLQKEIAKLEVENVSQQHKISALQKMQPQAKLIIKGLYDQYDQPDKNKT